MTTSIEREEYLRDFKENRQREALKQALDIRKFEIELYWKRGTYFWTFIAVAFAGYFSLQKDGEFASVFVITSLGFLFSLAWYFVNRGSGAWQRNWEAHVDLLEDEIMGPLYKTLINRRTYRFLDLAEPYSFSPSRINNILALSVTGVWTILMARTAWRAHAFEPPYSKSAILITLLTLAAAYALSRYGKSRSADDSISIRRRVKKIIAMDLKHPPSRPQ